MFNPIRHPLSHHPCDRQKSYRSHFIGSTARSDLWGIKWLPACPVLVSGYCANLFQRRTGWKPIPRCLIFIIGRRGSHKTTACHPSQPLGTHVQPNPLSFEPSSKQPNSKRDLRAVFPRIHPSPSPSSKPGGEGEPSKYQG